MKGSRSFWIALALACGAPAFGLAQAGTTTDPERARVQTALAQAQAMPRCLHNGAESRTEARRRQEALGAAHLINRVLLRAPTSKAPYPTWDNLANSSVVDSYRGMDGTVGDLARKIEWGTDEPLPGWAIHYVSERDAYAFTLIDTRDPCQFAYSSNDTGTVIQGSAISKGTFGVVPLDSSQ